MGVHGQGLGAFQVVVDLVLKVRGFAGCAGGTKQGRQVVAVVGHVTPVVGDTFQAQLETGGGVVQARVGDLGLDVELFGRIRQVQVAAAFAVGGSTGALSGAGVVPGLGMAYFRL